MSGLATMTREPMLRARYTAPPEPTILTLGAALRRSGRPQLTTDQLSFLGSRTKADDVPLYMAGDLSVLDGPAVAVVGARDVSAEGAARARRISRELAKAGVVVVSGLAKGVDANALSSAIDAGGRVAAVIGTPLSKAYPAENGALQAMIYAEHLLISPFAEGARVFPSNFPQRNRVMAAITDGSLIVEASDTSGTLHQAAECKTLGRWLFILRSVFDDPKLTWPKSFAKYDRMRVVDSTADVVGLVSA